MPRKMGIDATIRAYVQGLEKENARLREALAPFAFLEDATTQEAWEIRYNDRFKDWIDFDDMERARAALSTDGGEG